MPHADILNSSGDAEDLEAMTAFTSRSRFQKGLKARLEFGQRILRYLSRTVGSNGRQPYSRQVEKELAKVIGCHHSDVTRHRQFAEQFDTIEELYEKHGNLLRWSDVKQIITQSNKKSKQSQALKINQTIRQTEEVLRGLRMMNTRLGA